MKTASQKLIRGLRRLITLDGGQDLVEYALVVALSENSGPDCLRRHRRHEFSGHRPQHCVQQHQHNPHQLHVDSTMQSRAAQTGTFAPSRESCVY